MGLDNGIMLKGATKEDLATCPCFTWDDDNKEEQEMAYWRKCWGIRAVILKVLHVDSKGDGEFPVDPEDIPAILRGIKPFFSKEYWDDNAESIWEFDEMFDTMVDIYMRLTWLKGYLETHPDAKAYFYDSY